MHSFRTTFFGEWENSPRIHLVCPKTGITPTFLFWGWDWNPQSNSREGSGFLGRGHWWSWNFPFFGESKNTSVWQFWGSRFPCNNALFWLETKWLLSKLAPENWWPRARIYFLFGLVCWFSGANLLLHPGRWTAGSPTAITHFERNMIWTKPPWGHVSCSSSGV